MSWLVKTYGFYDDSDSDNVDDGELLSDDYYSRQQKQDCDWCSCNECYPMEDPDECICCQDIPQIVKKLDNEHLLCITMHPGFNTVVLDRYVLETAYCGYHMYDKPMQAPINEFNYRRYRYTAYRQFVRWCWGYLGKNNRVQLPACAISRIRASYSKECYGRPYSP